MSISIQIRRMGILAFSFMSFGVNAQQEYKAVAGETIKIPIPIKANSPCNIDIQIGASREQRQIEGPNYDLVINFQTQEVGTTEIRWEGKFRSRGLKSLPGCEGSGTIKVTTTSNLDQRKAEWIKLFGSLKPDQVECVKIGLLHRKILFDSIDPAAQIEAPNSPAAKEIFSKCDTFLNARRIWGTGNQEDFPCNLTSSIKSRCAGVYAERLPTGQLREISKETALQYHFDSKEWITAQREINAAKIQREAAEIAAQTSKDRAEAEARAQRERSEAESRARREAEAKAQRERAESDAKARREAETKAKENKDNTASNDTGAKASASTNQSNDSKWSVHSKCLLSDKNKFYYVDVSDLYFGKITTTEISILARGKSICFSGVATSRSDGTNSTELVFENNTFSCNQTTDADRLAAAKIRRTGYRVVGVFSGVLGKTIRMNGCQIENLP